MLHVYVYVCTVYVYIFFYHTMVNKDSHLYVTHPTRRIAFVSVAS